MFKRNAKDSCNNGSPENGEKPELYLRGTNSMPFEYELIPLEQLHPELREICMGIVHDSKRRYVETARPAFVGLAHILPLFALFQLAKTAIELLAGSISIGMQAQDSSTEQCCSFFLHIFTQFLKHNSRVMFCGIALHLQENHVFILTKFLNQLPYAEQYAALKESYATLANNETSTKNSFSEAVRDLLFKADFVTARLPTIIQDIVDQEGMPPFARQDVDELLQTANYVKVNDRGDLLVYKDYRSQFAKEVAFYRIPLLWVQMNQPFQRNHGVLNKVVRRDKKPQAKPKLQPVFSS